MARKISLFKVNSMGNISQLTPEICHMNARKNIETTVYLDLNIISAIRKFIFYEKGLNSDICSLVNNFIAIFSQLDGVYIQPGFAFCETDSTYTDRNIKAFNHFLEIHLPKFQDAYNAIEYQPSTSKEGQFYLYYAYASIYAIHYIKEKYKEKPSFDQFKQYISLIEKNLDYLDAVVCIIAIYVFAKSDYINQDIKSIIKNFVKPGSDKKKNSLNAAQDLFFLFTMRMMHNKKSPNFRGKIDSWCLTADNGLALINKIVSFPNEQSPNIDININSTGSAAADRYFRLCCAYLSSISIKRLVYSIVYKKDKDIGAIISKAETLINNFDKDVV